MQKKVTEFINTVSSIFLDKNEAVKFSTVCILAGGHLLIEDVPGVGKTTLVHTMGRLLSLKTNRIQFTIDLLPGDILGGHIFNPKDQQFHFHEGPIFAQLVLADELNRASPRTQSALLQAMEEGQVSLDGKTWDLPQPFFMIATQNPHQNLGTFLLPESQLDRFLMSLTLNYASKDTEIKIFQDQLNPRDKIRKLTPLYTPAELLEIQKQIETIQISNTVAEYVASLLENSRKTDFPGEALSTRAGLSIIKAAKAWAFLDDRKFLKPDDIKAVLQPVFSHRLGGTHGIQQGQEWAYQLEQQTAVPR
ncbi:MAG: AAA family ATPase [Pseudobdellovibrio sp.]